jgi:sulfate adenylyltransferase subunit 2
MFSLFVSFFVEKNRFLLKKNEKITFRKIRFRTLGCYPLTTAIESNAINIKQILQENKTINRSERAGRLIDSDKIDSMEIKKKDGYF